jgi:Cu/Ag efflux protein CusF
MIQDTLKFAVALALLAAMPLGAQPTVAEMTEGEVRKVDRETNKLTIKHGEIRNLDMPPMTMVFQVKNAAVLEKIKPGDKVRFAVEKTAAGFVVTELQPVP